MSNKTRKIYKGGTFPQEWMKINPEPMNTDASYRIYKTKRETILKTIETNKEASECLNKFTRMTYSLLLGTFKYWSRVKREKKRKNLELFLGNSDLQQIIAYVDLDNFPDNFSDFCAYKFVLKSSDKGKCVDPGKLFEFESYPPQATEKYWKSLGFRDPQKMRNRWIRELVEQIFLNKRLRGSEQSNSREIFYLLNELFYRDCPTSKDDLYFKERYSVMSIFWTLIWCRSIQSYYNKSDYNTSKPHFNTINSFFTESQINIQEIDDRINMLITIYGAKNIFQIIRIPDGDYSSEGFAPISKGGESRLAIITGDFEKKINVCHMGRPKVVPHIALTNSITPYYRSMPKGVPEITTSEDGSPVIKQSDEIYINKIKKLQERYLSAIMDTEQKQLVPEILREFKQLGPFIDKDGLSWVACIAPCVCMTMKNDEFKILDKCTYQSASCNNTGNFLSIPDEKKLPRPMVGAVKNPVLSIRELKFLFPKRIEVLKKNIARRRGIPVNEVEISDKSLREKLQFEIVPWEMGQWFMRVNPKSITYKVAQQNQQLVVTGISNHARLIMDFFSLFIPFKDFNNKKLLTARLVSSLIQPIHHTFNEIMRSVEYMGINFDPSLSEEENIDRLLKVEDKTQVDDLQKLFKSISYQTIIPYTDQSKYDDIYQTGVTGLGFLDEDEKYAKNLAQDVEQFFFPVYPEGLRRRRKTAKGGRKYNNKKIKRKKTRKIKQ